MTINSGVKNFILSSSPSDGSFRRRYVHSAPAESSVSADSEAGRVVLHVECAGRLAGLARRLTRSAWPAVDWHPHRLHRQPRSVRPDALPRQLRSQSPLLEG